MLHGQFAQHFFTLRGEVQQYLTPVLACTASSHQAPGGEPVYELDSTVVLKLHPLSQIPDGWRHPSWKSLERQHQLMLLRFQSLLAGRLFTEMYKAADLITEFRQRFIVGHIYIVSRYI